jgi:hypothetical protein
MIYAQIKDGIVKNRIVVEDVSLDISIFAVGYDLCIRVDEMSPEPQVDWLYDSQTQTFTQPEPSQE